MKYIISILLLMMLSATDFKSDQKKYSRVADAYKEKESVIKSVLAKNQINIDKLEIFIRILKKEESVELWARNKGSKFSRIETYPICATSGTLGPKRRQGDGQTPEGFYFIDTFNPVSNFHLSLGINYPNKSDKILGNSKNPGGEIFIHGNCVTIGCIPITNDKIKELYIYAVEARNNGQQNIPVHIFPTTLTDANLLILKKQYESNPNLIRFWENLKTGFDYFEKNHTLPSNSVNKQGYYEFN